MKDTFSQVAAQPVVILGFAREGWSSYSFIRARFPDKKMYILDQKKEVELPPSYQAAVHSDANAVYLDYSREEPEVVAAVAKGIVVKTPGIPRTSSIAQLLDSPETVFTSNLQLFLEVVAQEKEDTTIIGITGTKGKSTTTSLIYHVLQAAGLPVVLGGNIGVPPLELVSELPAKGGIAVIEMSSHQLAGVSASPDIAVVQHISPEHLDYYHDFEEYFQAKSHIALFQQPTDLLIFNAQSETAARLAASSKATKIGFVADGSPYQDKEPGVLAWGSQEGIFYHGHLLVDGASIPLKGQHNLLNILPSVIIAKQLGVANETISEAIRSFTGLEHRLEWVAEVQEVEFYNDSLATTPEATQAAVAAMGGKPVVLIAGGVDRNLHQDQYVQLGKFLKGKLRGLVLFPETGALIRQQVEQALQQEQPMTSLPIVETTSMSEAVATAQKLAQPGDAVVLSPAAASFNLFKDYQDRGDQFKTAVLSLAAKGAGT